MRKKQTYFLTLLLTALFLLPWSGKVWAAQSLPYDYGFEDYNLATDGWTKTNPSNKNNGEFIIAGSGIQRTGSYGFRFSSFTDSGESTQYLISPELDAPNGVIVTFYYKASSTSGTETFKVGYSTTGTDVSNFTFGDEISTSSTSWESYENTFPVGTKYIAVYYYANYQYRLYVDDFTFASAGLSNTCPAPSALTKGAITSTSAAFTWTAGKDETSWQYVYLPAATALTDAAWSSATSGTVNTTPELSLSGLTANTDYKLYVRAYCSSTDQSGEISVAFSTPCDAVPSITSYGFEDVTTGSSVYNIPSCWNRIAYESSWYGTLPYVANGSSSAHGGNNYLYFYGGSSTSSSIIVLPPISSPDTKAISFWYKTSVNASYGTLQIGYMSDPKDASTFLDFTNGTLEQTSDYKQVDGFSLSGMPSTSYIAIRFIGGSSAYGAAYLDDIEVFTPSSCTKPTNLSATASSPTSANVSWTAGGSETKWDLQYRVKGTSAWTAVTGLTSASHSLSSLTGNTTYEIQVQADCDGDQSGWTASAEVHTPCDAVTTFPWTADFTGVSAEIIPDCWDNSASTCTLPWDNTEYYIWGTYTSSGNTMLRLFSAYINADGYAVINTPLFTLPNANDFQFLFDYSHKANCGAFKVKMSVDGAPFADLGTYTNETGTTSNYPGTFTSETIDLSSYNLANKTVQFQFYAEPNYGNGAIFIDNVKVRKAPTCFIPSGLTISNVGSASANLSWTAGASETNWKVQYKADGAGSWTDIAVSGSASCSLTGLEPTTTYYVQVIADCGSGDYSEPTAQSSFTTTCAAETMPFEENFGTTNAVPDCWSVGKTGGSYQWAPNYDTYPNYYMQFRTSSGSTYSYLHSAPIELSEDAVLTFDWRNSNSVTADILVSTDGGATATPLQNDLSSTQSSWQTKTFDLSAYTGETVVIIIRGYNGTSNRYLRIDNFAINPKPCDLLTNVNVVPTMDGGTVTWTGDAKKLQYRAGTSGAWTSVTIAEANKAQPHTLTGLASSTEYQVRGLSLCGDESVEDNWTAPVSFTTRCAASNELPYSNNFDNETAGEMPSCWAKLANSGINPQIVSGEMAYGGTGKYLCFSGNVEQIAILPAFAADLSTLTIQFYYYHNSYADFQLGYVKADGVTFVALETLASNSTYGDEPFEKDLANISNEAVCLALRMTNTTSASAKAYVDNLVLKTTPTCFKPATLNVSEITANGAKLTWTASGKGETQYQYCLNNDWEHATVTEENVLSVSLSELNPNTEYTFCVRSYCDANDQSDVKSVSFTTLCATVNLAWEYDFEDDALYGYPECWNTLGNVNYGVSVNNANVHAGQKALYVTAPKTTGQETYVILPKFGASSFSGVVLSFWYRGTTDATIEVGSMSDIEDKNSFAAIGDALVAGNAYQRAFVSLNSISTSTNLAIRFKGFSGDAAFYIDDIRVAKTVVFDEADNNTFSVSDEVVDVIMHRNLLFNGDYNTLCLPFSLSEAQLAESPLAEFKLKVFDYSAVVNDELQIAIAGASSIEAGQPYFAAFQGSADPANKALHLFKDVKISANAAGSKTSEQVTYQGVLNKGTLADQSSNSANPSILYLGPGNTIYWPSGDLDIKGFRAYFSITYTAGSPVRPNMSARIVENEEVATGVEDAQSNVQSLKVLENGQVIIIRNGVKYNVQGQLIEK